MGGIEVTMGIKRSSKWLAALVAIALLSAACTRSPEAKSAKFMAEGKKLLEKKDAVRAILQFQNAAQATPKDPEVYYQLGQALLAAGDLPKGIAALRKALELSPKHAAAQLRLADLMALTNDPKVLKDAKERLQGLLQDTPENAEVLHALALTELKLGEPGDAMDYLGRALSAAPKDLIIAVTTAEVKLQAKDPRGAEDILKKACQNSPDSVDAVVVLGRFYVSQNRTEEADQQFQRALAMDRDNAAALLNLAMLQYHTGKNEDAERTFKHLSSLPDKQFRPFYGVFLYQEGKRQEAVQEFEKQVKQDPDDRTTRTRLVAGYIAVNRVADAEKILEQALKKNSKDLDALLQRGELFVAARKYTQAEADLNQVAHLQPDSAQLYYVMGKLNQARGSDLAYRENLYKALQHDSSSLPIRLELSQALLGTNAKAALDVLDTAPESQKQSTPVLVQRNWVFLALGDMKSMRASIDLGLSREKSPELLLQDGLWKLRAGDFGAAQVALEASLNGNPGEVRALAALNEAYFAQKKGLIAIEKVKAYASKLPDSAPVQQFLGTMLWATGDIKGARTAFEAAIASDKNFVTAKLALAQMDAGEGKIDESIARVRSILLADSGNVTAQLWLGMLEEVKGNHDVALEQFRDVVRKDPNNAKALNNLASLLAEYANKPDEALPYAQKAVEIGPDNPEFADTLGWVLYRKGLYAASVQQLERAAAHQDKPIWKFHLAMAYSKLGDVKRGRAALDAGLKMNPNVPEAKLAKDMLAQVK